MQDFRIKEILRVMDELEAACEQHKQPYPDPKAVAACVIASKSAVGQEEEIAMTPWMKNLLIWCGDLKLLSNGHHERLLIDKAGKTKAEDLLKRLVHAALLKFNGPERTKYNESLSVLDPDHYNVDCWDQNKFATYMFDIKEGQAKQRAEMIAQYETMPHLTVSEVKGLLKTDPIFQKAALMMLEIIPHVKAEREIRKISAPFQSKDSNVGYPEPYNDRTLVSKDSGITYGEKAISEAIRITKNMNFPWAVMSYNVYVEWARNQRGKGRLILGESRIYNLVVNCLEAPELEAAKKMPQFVGLRDDLAQKETMIKMGEFCDKTGFKCCNMDQDAYDVHVGGGFACLMAALRKINVNGNLAKTLCDIRYYGVRRFYTCNGSQGKLTVDYGRTPSGYIDTTMQNSWLTVFLVIYCLMYNDEEYSNDIWYKIAEAVLSLGDDMNYIYRDIDKFAEKFSKAMKKLGFDVKPEKFAFGCFFLQYRLYKKDGEYVMVYPWPRVLRSMLSKENKKGLGPVGWAMSAWQQLAKLKEDKLWLSIVLNIILPLDPEGLYLDKDVSWIKEQIKMEDKIALEKDKRARPTHEKLNSNNPQQSRQFDENGDLKEDYFSELQSIMRPLVQHGFWESLGFKTPNISKQLS